MFKQKKYIFVAVIIIFSIVAIYMSAINRENTLFADNAIGYITKPFASFATDFINKTTDFFEYFSNKKEIIRKNYELENKLAKLEHENSSLKSLEAENERLRTLLDFKEKNPQYKLLTGKVISKDNSNYYSTFIINIGKSENVKTNMPVIGAKGLIGYIAETGEGFSKVQTIIEGGSSVGCLISRTGATALLEGTTIMLKDGLMKMTYVTKEMNLVEGDILETSGLGQIYPPGIAIGRIKKICTDNVTKSQYAEVKPVEDFKLIREVFVITNSDKIGK